MDVVAATDFASLLGTTINILYVAIGLGLVIFFHELGHFAVAKWCDVHVERFSIGFGPVLWSWKGPETEYAISAVPFGGYVKMLGQDDLDPSQLSSEEIAENPRAYSAKPVRQRMAIISAGVIMNVITGMLFFAAAFGLGVTTPPPVIGTLTAGQPAWVAGIEHGDRITRINEREIRSFSDVMRGVALSTGELTVEGVHRNGETYTKVIQPDESGNRREIGVRPTTGLTVATPRQKDLRAVVPGTPTAEADPTFQAGDRIRRLDEEGVESFAELQELLALKRSEPVDFYVQREGGSESLTKLTIGPNRFRTLGLWMDIGQIAAIEDGSPAARAGLQVGDKIAQVKATDEAGFQDVGRDINPLRLPEYFAELGRAGKDVVIKVKRPVQGEGENDVSIAPFRPTAEPAWIERPSTEHTPLSAPAIGIAYHVNLTVLEVEPGSPAEGHIEPGDRVRKIELFRPEGAPPDGSRETVTLDFAQEEDRSRADNWAAGFWLMQGLATRDVRLTVSRDGENKTVTLSPRRNPQGDWFLPTRGIRMEPLLVPLQADGVLQAVGMGLTHTKNSLTDIYLTLRNLLTGSLSVKEIHGPVGIATVAYEVANQGMADLLLFLGFLSVNLAVLNFLPIPVLDGGHMLFLCWEAVMRRRPSERVVIAATYLGMAFVLGLMILVLWLDLFVHRHAG